MKKNVLYSFLLILVSLLMLFVFLIISLVNCEISLNILTVILSCFFLFSLYFVWNLVYIQPRQKRKNVQYNDVLNKNLTVVLTAYNDELSIADSVRDFSSHPLVKRVIVISNNSTDKTIEFAKNAGAIVYNEFQQGYGSCVYRALSEGVKFDDTELTLLCEGDMTFRAYDIDKFLAYMPHADIVSGTRIVDQLRSGNTQLTNFMYYGNFFVGKLLELKHISKGTFTDVGTTYKLCRNDALKVLLPKLDNSVNLQFNPYFLDNALQYNLMVVECPVTFHPRVGVSKGGNISNIVAFKLGLKMIYGIVIKW
jgi:glycosyltransferase involved in cell wall biosynthesis